MEHPIGQNDIQVFYVLESKGKSTWKEKTQMYHQDERVKIPVPQHVLQH